LTTTTFESLLGRKGSVVIDGGLATQLETQGCDISNDLWSASVIDSDPRQIIDAHRAFLDAGAEIVIAASYQTVDPQLLAGSIYLARQARDEFLHDNPGLAYVPLVAASVGPYGAVLGDGSEYTGNYDIDADGLRDFHQQRLELLDNSGADLLACETIPSHTEGVVLGELLARTKSPSWVCFSCCDGGRISDGTPIEDAVGIFQQHTRVLAVGVNCTRPQYVAELIARINAVLPDKAIVVYPNSGETFNAHDKSWSGTVTTADWAESAREWRAAGATVIGGCCRTGPEHVRAISESR